VNLNQVSLVGNLTRDPELREAGGTSVCDLGLAVNERIKRKGEWQEEASFFDITVWGNQADACAKYLHKGSPVAVGGSLRQERWEKDGQNRSKVKVIARTVQFLGGKNGDSDGEKLAKWQSGQPIGGDSEDLPF